jgi:hypothetical protein
MALQMAAEDLRRCAVERTFIRLHNFRRLVVHYAHDPPFVGRRLSTVRVLEFFESKAGSVPERGQQRKRPEAPREANKTRITLLYLTRLLYREIYHWRSGSVQTRGQPICLCPGRGPS